MKQFTIECHESLSASDIFENLKQCYPQMIFDVTEQVRPTLAAPDKCPSCSGSGRYHPNYPTASRPCMACGGTGIRR